ncbi:MAG: aminopeptidase N [Myxococcaceae bacterium]|nr:aminopeptidase N [Myxococcaceae bacterium]MCA3014967.1 aminopeptidase N [Myxococcaceae bacterium]
MLRDATPKTTRLVDYSPPDFAIDSVALTFDLDAERTEVEATLSLRRLSGAGPLSLHGDSDAEGSGQLLSIALDGQPLAEGRYALTDAGLTLQAPPDRFTLTTRRRLSPSKNKSLEGLYASGSGLFTQCEAEGFRKITWYLDRPDVMSVFTVTLRADPARFPVLLSNGNKVSERDEVVDGRTRRVAVWHDPHKKPAYLFAVVAADLVARRDRFTTMSGKPVELNVWVRAHDLDQTAHCMDSLKKSMQWDEVRFGREYDLDVFNLVAVSDFNMGAMENKGLNVFNTKFVLARPDTATDVDFAGIEAVVGHEYFHNWSGNRVTCRDWFQLSLKEGFTVFRDQEFSSDVGSRAVRRIEEVRRLRSLQFPEDGGPTAHPVRPDSYVEISNFYTVTIYEKGAEVVRMYLTLLGDETFRRGTDLYFSRHDGQAVTTDDFLKCMAEVSGRDFTQFQRWYSQAGTPKVTATSTWSAEAGAWTLTLRQAVPPTPGQPEKRPMLIPVTTALLGAGGRRLPLVVNGVARGSECVLELTEAAQTFVFSGLTERPVPSLLRGFSAPVVLETDDDEAALLFRLAHDDDAFNRVEAGQELFLRHLLASVAALQGGGGPLPASPKLVGAVKTALEAARMPGADPSLLALALSVPGLDVIGDRLPWADYGSAQVAREHLVTELATQLSGLVGEVDALLSRSLDGAAYRFTPEDVGRRSLRNLLVAWRARLPGGEAHAQAHLERASCMTDTQAALALLSNTTGPARDRAFADFYARWKGEALMVDKWFALQATSTRPQALDDVLALVKHEAFTLENPNRARSVIAALGMSNPLRFHEASGRGYVFLADVVRTLDGFNPQIAARMLTPLTRWRRQDAPRQALMKRELQRVLDREGCSKDVYEIASKSLA